MNGGMDNPVELAFTAGGERIIDTTFFQHPGGGRRDGLIHAIYGGAYGKDHAVIHEHPWTSPDLMPVLTHMGAAAPAGLMRYESDVFGPEYKDNLFWPSSICRRSAGMCCNRTEQASNPSIPIS